MINFSPANIYWPLCAFALASAGPQVTKAAKKTASIASIFIDDQRFFHVVLPDNILLNLFLLIPAFHKKYVSKNTHISKTTVIIHLIISAIIGCYLMDFARSILDRLFRNKIFLLAPSDRKSPQLEAKDQLIPDDQLLSFSHAPVGLGKDVKKYIDEICCEFEYPEARVTYQLKPLCGILIYGPPGTGKTSLARHIASRIKCKTSNYHYISGSSILGSYLGQSEKNLRDIFEKALEQTDRKEVVIIAIDEVDSFLSCRTIQKISQSAIGNSLVNQFLTCMDQIRSLKNVLLISITNHKEHIDFAALRGGRFDIHLHIDKPSWSDVYTILNHYLEPLRERNLLSDAFDIEEIWKRAWGMTGADIEAFVESAKRSAVSKMRNKSDDKSKVHLIDCSDFELPCQKEALGIERLAEEEKLAQDDNLLRIDHHKKRDRLKEVEKYQNAEKLKKAELDKKIRSKQNTHLFK